VPSANIITNLHNGTLAPGAVCPLGNAKGAGLGLKGGGFGMKGGGFGMKAAGANGFGVAGGGMGGMGGNGTCQLGGGAFAKTAAWGGNGTCQLATAKGGTMFKTAALTVKGGGAVTAAGATSKAAGVAAGTIWTGKGLSLGLGLGLGSVGGIALIGVAGAAALYYYFRKRSAPLAIDEEMSELVDALS